MSVTYSSSCPEFYTELHLMERLLLSSSGECEVPVKVQPIAQKALVWFICLTADCSHMGFISYKNCIQIIYIQLYGLKYFYLILIIYTQLYHLNYYSYS